MHLTDEQNIRFASNKNRQAAEKRLLAAKSRVVELSALPVQTILSFMPRALEELRDASEALIIAEAQAESEAREENQ